jgi:hypothetical protein
LHFVVGGSRYDCPRIIADSFSPTVSLQHSVDPSITEYIVNTNDMNEYFDLFKSVWEGSAIRLPEANRPFLVSLSREFCDSDVSVSILKQFHSCYPLNEIHNYFGESSIPFLASKFDGLTLSQLDNI